MEIGQLSLMPKSNNHTHIKDLSIHSFADGFSFCTHPSPKFSSFSTLKKTPQELLNTFFEEEESFSHINWVSFEYPSLFVPEVLYDNDYKERYMEHFTTYTDAFTLQANYLEQAELYNIYPQITGIEKQLTTNGQTATFLHANTLLFNEILSEVTTLMDDEKRFYIHLQKNCFDLFVFEGKNLQLSNRYEINEVDEFLYYLFFVVEQYQLKADQFTLVFMGKFTIFNPIYEAVKNYHKTVQFLKSACSESLSVLDHPAPFSLNLSI